MTRNPPFGHPMRKKHFSFSSTYTPLNHGSFGAYPIPVQTHQSSLLALSCARPDTFIVTDLPVLIDASRTAIAPLLGVPVSEVVFVPNATTGINTVLRNLKWEKDDVVVHFSTIYDSCEKTLASIAEVSPLECSSIELQYPVEDEDVVRLLRERIGEIKEKGKRVKLAMFDTVLTFPGVRMPWEELTKLCKEMGVLSLIDGAHGIGCVDLTHLGDVGPDFFVSNCHKWLYTPRSCAIFHVPIRNQHLIKTSLPTSHGYELPAPSSSLSALPESAETKSLFVRLFEFVATIDYTPYCCIISALLFRQSICGGESTIRSYNTTLARSGGALVASLLGTHTLDNKTHTLSECSFTNVALPITTKGPDDGSEVARWINSTAVRELDTYLQVAYHAGFIWVRLSAQIYLEVRDFEWIGKELVGLCGRAERGEWRETRVGA